MKQKRKNVGIVTMIGPNYGNRLQNYAVYYTLNSLGYQAVTITDKKRSYIKLLIKKFAWAFRSVISYKYREILQAWMFELFAERYISIKYEDTENNLFTHETGGNYDFFVVGSDQVWNGIYGEVKVAWNNYLLAFAPPHKRHSFSPSIGIRYIPEELKEKFAKEVSLFVNLCIREESGTQLVKEYTGRSDVLTTIDPVLMLDDKQWMKIAKKIKTPKTFVLEYFLGDKPNTDEVVAGEVDRVQLLNPNNKYYFTTPGQFVWLFYKAEMVCTDSFHACVFSILFAKSVVVYKRKSSNFYSNLDMFSRIETLFSMFGVDINEHIGKPIKIDIETRDKVLKEKREELIKALKLP